MSSEIDRKGGETFEQELHRAYSSMEPVVQVIFMRAMIVAAKERTVSAEVAFSRASDLIDRYRDGYSPTIADLQAIGEPKC